MAASDNTDVKTGSLGANTSKGKLKILLNGEEVVTCYLQYAIKHAKDGKNDIQFQKNKPAETNLDEGVYAYAIFPASKGLSKFGIKFLETDNKKVNLYVSTATAMPTSASEMTQIVSNVAAGTQLTWSDFEFTGTGDGDDKIEPKDVKWVMYENQEGSQLKVEGFRLYSAEDTKALNKPAAAKPATANDQTYNILGQPVTPNYKGIVIRNGAKYIQK